MNSALRNLLSISSDALHLASVPNLEMLLESPGIINDSLLQLLRCKNGFFAFESALHVFPLGSRPTGLDLANWNDFQTWRFEYGELISKDILFFAQDAFGNQFGLNDEGVVLFYSEFAETEVIAKDLDEWAEVLLADWRGYSGYDLTHKWQVEHRPLAEGERLVPKVPFITGGKYEVDNLYAGQAIQTMRFRGLLARQLIDLPDGTPITLNIKHGNPFSGD